MPQWERELHHTNYRGVQLITTHISPFQVDASGKYLQWKNSCTFIYNVATPPNNKTVRVNG
jgi:hypothetical protein